MNMMFLKFGNNSYGGWCCKPQQPVYEKPFYAIKQILTL